MRNVPQSIKKLDRILKLVRRLSYEDAVSQCKVVPHKAARFVIQALEKAHEDAVAKKLNPKLLVVDIIHATKGYTLKTLGYQGRGSATMLKTRHSHIKVQLRESSSAQAPRFRARQGPTLMVRWQAAGGQRRQRFAYNVEV